jgi:DNA-directed RNA polymerase subunit M/transcription elongation factor TFIIS
MICDKCHAGQMAEYERTLTSGGKKTTIFGRRCDRCGYIRLDSDDDIWSVVGL